MPNNSPSKKVYDEVRKYFHDEGQTIIVIDLDTSSISKETINKMIKIQDYIEQNTEVSEINGPVSILNTNTNSFFSRKNIENINVSLYVKFLKFMDDFSPLKKCNGKYYAIFTLIPDKEKNLDYKLLEKYFNKNKIKYYITADDY